MSPSSRKALLFFLALALLAALPLFFRGGSRPFFQFEKRPASPEAVGRRLAEVEKRLSKNPEDLKALVERGVLCFHLGPERAADALNSLNAAWRLGAMDERIFYYSGILYENLSLFTEARKQYERYLRHRPKDREIRLRLARLLFRMEEWEESVESYQKLLAENPKDLTTLVNLGLAMQKKCEILLKRPEKLKPEENNLLQTDLHMAIHYLERAAEIRGALPADIDLVLAGLYLQVEEWGKAAALADAELARKPDDAAFAAVAASAYEKSGSKERALAAYERLAALDPKNGAARRKVRLLKNQLKVK